jgi:spore coat protein CotH
MMNPSKYLAMFLMTLTACNRPSTAVPSTTDTATAADSASHAKGTKNYDLVFDDAAVRRLDIVISAADYQAMEEDMVDMYGTFGQRPSGGPGQFSEDTPLYVPVTVTYEDDTWEFVGMRYKGNSSLASAWREGVRKLPFRLHFDKYEEDEPSTDDQRFWGFQELKFSSAFTDHSLIRDKLASDVIRGAGVPAAKMAMVRVHVDVGDGPVFWGVYAMAEDPCGALLDSWFGDDSGNCYKPESQLNRFSTSDFEKKTNKEEADYNDVQTLVELLDSSETGAEWRDALEDVLDVPGVIRYLAIHNLIQNWDAYGRMSHNFYLYGDPDNGDRLTWIPWDFNEAFHNQGRPEALTLGMDEVQSDWPLIRRLMDDPTYAQDYRDELARQLETGFDVAWVESHATHLHELVSPYAIGEDGERAPHTWLPVDDAFVFAVEQSLLPAVRSRAEEARAWLAQP